MALNLLAHFSIRTTKLAATKDFYCKVLGMSDGKRPPFDFPGHWLYLGERDMVHLVGIDLNDPSGLIAYLGDKELGSLEGSAAIDHIAFFATDLPDLLKRVEAEKVPVRHRTVPALNLHQVFLEDPNGITIELNYPASEAPKDPAKQPAEAVA